MKRKGEMFTAIAKDFGVCGNNIRDIQNGKTWNHITGLPKLKKIK